MKEKRVSLTNSTSGLPWCLRLLLFFRAVSGSQEDGGGQRQCPRPLFLPLQSPPPATSPAKQYSCHKRWSSSDTALSPAVYGLCLHSLLGLCVPSIWTNRSSGVSTIAVPQGWVSLPVLRTLRTLPPHLAFLLTPGNHSSFIVLIIVTPQMSYSWNHTLHGPFRLAFSLNQARLNFFHVCSYLQS